MKAAVRCLSPQFLPVPCSLAHLGRQSGKYNIDLLHDLTILSSVAGDGWDACLALVPITPAILIADSIRARFCNTLADTAWVLACAYFFGCIFFQRR